MTSDGAVSDEDGTTNFNTLSDVFIAASNLGVVSFVCVICANFKSLSQNEVNVFSSFQNSSSDFGTFGVEHKSDSLVWSLFESFIKVSDLLSM